MYMPILKNVTGKKLVVHEEIKEEKTFYKWFLDSCHLGMTKVYALRHNAYIPNVLAPVCERERERVYVYVHSQK